LSFGHDQAVSRAMVEAAITALFSVGVEKGKAAGKPMRPHAVIPMSRHAKGSPQNQPLMSRSNNGYPPRKAVGLHRSRNAATGQAAGAASAIRSQQCKP